MPIVHQYNAKYAVIQCQMCCIIVIVFIIGIGCPVKMALCAQMALCDEENGIVSTIGIV